MNVISNSYPVCVMDKTVFLLITVLWVRLSAEAGDVYFYFHLCDMKTYVSLYVTFSYII